ncbi:AraC family transcriptional regulator [Novosphingobium sp. B 225]|uniref:AraC family transcriptional regulator n=1 Tax=Novosphingobium sp. B 225 TaxID=1961849 RepID=UPI000B4BE64B|nr:AraC family transcriptional regulator [Novosphingobium sp. B 225]
MSAHELELLARGGTLALLALWSWLLWRDSRAQLAARCAIAMNVAIASYVFVTSGWSETPSPEGLLFSLAAGSTPGLFWLFAKTWFEDLNALARRDLALVLLAAANSLVMQLSFAAGGPVNLISSALFRLAMLGFAGAGLWHAWRGREGDLIEGRRRVRFWMVVTVGLYVVAITFAEPLVYGGGAPRVIMSLIGASTAFSTLGFCAAMFGVRQADMFGASARPGQRQPLPQDAALAERLHQLMEREKPHRDEGLSIAALAARLGEQEYRLRRTINQGLGHRNFAQFLNSWRLAEVKQALADPAQREVPILTIALDAGFGSLGPFNRAFREAEGATPSEYRARALADSEIG